MPNENETISIPAYTPANVGTQAGITDFAIRKALEKLEKVAPAQIISYDRTTNRASVQILNQSITSTGEKLTKKPLENIPVLMMSGGGFTFSFPINQGDTGWIVAADRDISVFKQLLQVFAPASYQIHRYKDSFFIPDKVNGFELAEEDKNAVILTSLDGTTKISVIPGQATITTLQTVINGNLQVNGSIIATDTITSNTDVISAGISGKSHTHSGVEPGGGSTGAPQ
jgi:hypothetical protein